MIWSCNLVIDLYFLFCFLSCFISSKPVLKHYKYIEIKQLSKVDIKQNNVSIVILLIKFLVYH